MIDPIKVGIIRCDTHGVYYGPLMARHDPLKLQKPVPLNDDPPYSWQNGVTHFYFYAWCADPRTITVETVDGFEIVNVWDVHREAAEVFSDLLESRPRVCETFDQVSDGVDLVPERHGLRADVFVNVYRVTPDGSSKQLPTKVSGKIPLSGRLPAHDLTMFRLEPD